MAELMMPFAIGVWFSSGLTCWVIAMVIYPDDGLTVEDVAMVFIAILIGPFTILAFADHFRGLPK